jgi:hypothetical protein
MIIALSVLVLLVGMCIYIVNTSKWATIGLVMFGAGLLAFLLLGSPYFVAVFSGSTIRVH